MEQATQLTMICDKATSLRRVTVISLLRINPSLKSSPENVLTNAAIKIPYILTGRNITRERGTV